MSIGDLEKKPIKGPIRKIKMNESTGQESLIFSEKTMKKYL